MKIWMQFLQFLPFTILFTLQRTLNSMRTLNSSTIRYDIPRTVLSSVVIMKSVFTYGSQIF